MAHQSLKIILLCLLVFVWALGSWLGINAVFSLTAELVSIGIPEGWAINSQLTLAVQCGNAFLLAYLCYASFAKVNLEVFWVLSCILLSAVGLFLLSFFWSARVSLSGSMHSVGLLALTVVLGGANTLSSPIFLPVLTQYPPAVTSAFATGEAATSLVAALVALIQKAVGQAHFPIRGYFLTMTVVQLCAGVAYILLRKLPLAQRVREVEETETAISKDTDETKLLMPAQESVQSSDDDVVVVGSTWQRWIAVSKLLWRHLLVTFWLNWMETGAILTVLTFATQIYGSSFYAAALWGGMVAAPAGCLLTSVVVWGRCWSWCLVWLPLGLFVIVNSIVQVLPHSGVFGGFVVACAIVVRFVLGYNKALIYLLVQQVDSAKQGGMLVVAFTQQLGSLVGTIFFFVIINYTSLY